MERTAWTDERLDDLSRRMDAGFERLSSDTREGFARVDTDIRELRGEISALRGVMLRFNAAIVAGLLGVIAAVLARGT